jgi:glutathione synthase/RimK-type ligase-like ATP-grasp enzyme
VPGWRWHLAVAASAGFAELDASWPLLRDALARRGFRAVVEAWDDESMGWASFDVVMPLYCWGYATRVAEFLSWAEATGGAARLVNPAAVIAWNADKRYLVELAADGVPVVPTTWVGPGEQWTPPAGEFVVKPAVASGAAGAARYAPSAGEAADRHVRRLHAAGATAMVQPYQSRLDTAGETAVVFVDGQPTHAVRKGPLLDAGAGEVDRLWEREAISATTARAEQIEVATRALASAGRRAGAGATYARVDLLDGETGPVVLEVELIEPTLHLLHAPEAAGRLAAALARVVTGA